MPSPAGMFSRATRRTAPMSTRCRSRVAACGAPVSRIPDVGNPWLDAGIVPFSTLHYREDPANWARWFPADFITESFPGQFRNWFYSMLAMSTVLRREAPFRAIFGYATLFGEDGRADAQELGQRDRVRRGGRADGRRRHALDVRQRAPARQHPVRLARRRRGPARAAGALERLRVLRHLREPGRAGAPGIAAPPVAERPVARPLDPLAPGGPRRAGGGSPGRLRHDAAAAAISGFIDELSTWYLRRSRRSAVAGERGSGPRGGLRDPPRGARRTVAGRRPHAAVPVRGDPPEPRGRRRPWTRPTAST